MSLTSTTSEFLIRFTTNGNSNNGIFYKGNRKINIFEGTDKSFIFFFTGFLAFYTTVPCNNKREDTNDNEYMNNVTPNPMMFQTETSKNQDVSTLKQVQQATEIEAKIEASSVRPFF